MSTFALTNPLVAGTNIRQGNNEIWPTSGSQSITVSGGVTHTGQALKSNLLTIAVTKIGTLTGDCSLDLELSIDGGSNYRKTGTGFTNTEMGTAGGYLKSFQVKATHWRVVLIPGTMTGANGANIRALD